MEVQPIDVEMDIAIAGQVMGWKQVDPKRVPAETEGPTVLFYVHRTRGVMVSHPSLIERGNRRGRYLQIYHPWSPTTSIAHAFAVVDRLDSAGYWLSLAKASLLNSHSWCEFRHNITQKAYSATHQVREIAICRAALEVIKHEKI